MSILVATDGLPHSEKAVRFAIDLAKCRKTTLYVLHIVRGRRGVENEKIIKAGMLLLEGIKSLGAAYGVPVVGLLESGSTYDLIIAKAEENEADIIVVGTSGKPHEESGQLMGSVSEHVVHSAMCTVVVVR